MAVYNLYNSSRKFTHIIFVHKISPSVIHSNGNDSLLMRHATCIQSRQGVTFDNLHKLMDLLQSTQSVICFAAQAQHLYPRGQHLVGQHRPATLGCASKCCIYCTPSGPKEHSHLIFHKIHFFHRFLCCSNIVIDQVAFMT